MTATSFDRLKRLVWAGLSALIAVALVVGHQDTRAQETGTPAAAVAPATAVVYLTIANDGDAADLLLGGATSAANTVELHQTADDNGVIRMQPRPDGIEIPAGEATVFDSGGNHVMLVGLLADLVAGAGYDLTLRFQTAGEVTVPVQIRFKAEPDADEPGAEPVTAGDLTISDAWTRPAPALIGIASVGTAEPAGLGTPVVVGDLVVVLTSDGATAGPRFLTVAVTDATGAPVTDATVSVSTRSLEMDHGVSTKETEMVEPGRYLSERLSMGMEGGWDVEVTISRPGADDVVIPFVISLTR